MGDDPTLSGGAEGGASGATPNDQKPGEPAGGTNKEKESNARTVSWDSHQRALSDLNKEKQARRDLEARIGDLESKSLQEKNDYKSLYEREKSKREAAESETTKVKNWAFTTQRFNEVKTEALKAGIIPSSVEDIEILLKDDSEVKVEVTSSGRFIVEGAKEFVDKVKGERPHWFSKSGAPNVNGAGGGQPPPNPKELTPHDVYVAERQWKAGKITRTDYEKVYRDYSAQSAAKK